MIKQKKVIVALGMSLLIACSGCSKETSVHKENSSKTPAVTADGFALDDPEEEDALSPYYTFGDTDDKNMAAMFHIGVGNKEKDEKLPELLEKYHLRDNIFEIVADHDDCEWYAIFPKYIGTKIIVEHVELDDDGNLNPTEKLTETEKPILLSCNQSDIVPSVKVTIKNDKEQIEFNPFISLENGEIQKVDRVYSLSE